MCGIFGYVGEKRDATLAVFDGLKRLDYRGYDSWGIGVIQKSGIVMNKHIGVINKKLLKLPQGSIAIGHTRWATNGAVTVPNAHPHWASDKSFILAHNGIAENFNSLKTKLQKKGYRFVSETDTEVIVHLVEEKRKGAKDLAEAVRLAFKELKGRNTIIVLSKDGEIIAARNGSPLVVGETGNFSEIYLSSDTLSFAPYVEHIIVLDNGQMVTCSKNRVDVFDIKTGNKIKHKLENNTIIDSVVDKEGYAHFMIKEIHEEPSAINRVIDQPDQELIKFAKIVKRARNVYCIGSGTAGATAAQMAYYLRLFGNIPAVGLIGAEAWEYIHLVDKKDIIIVLSQSGETADVLEILEKVKKKGTPIASFINMPGSMITRLSDYKFMAQAGPEICVMSTKIFVSQLAWGYLVAKAVQGKLKDGKIKLRSLSKHIAAFLQNKKTTQEIRHLAQGLGKNQDVFLLSKGQNLQIIKEGMIKIIEGSYIHAHAIAAGDLKHYAITLMEPGVPVIFIISNDEVKTDVINSLNEVKARGAYIIGIGSQREIGFDEYLAVPDMGEVSAIINIVPLQLLAYYTAASLGNNVDKPRNIAKSVTVK